MQRNLLIIINTQINSLTFSLYILANFKTGTNKTELHLNFDNKTP